MNDKSALLGQLKIDRNEEVAPAGVLMSKVIGIVFLTVILAGTGFYINF